MHSTSGDRLGQDLSTAVVLLHEELGRAAGLTAADYKALGFVRREGPLPLGEFANRLGVVPSAAAAIADRLERAGHVERCPDPAARRRVPPRAASSPAPEHPLAARVRGPVARA